MPVFALDRLVRDVKTRLETKAVPLQVIHGGEEHGEDTTNDDAVVVFEEVDDGDRFSPEIPRMGADDKFRVGTLTCACQAEIRYASIAEGATPKTHREAVKALVHQVIAAMVIESSKRRIPVEFGSLGFVSDAEADSEYGARYVIRFAVPEVVADDEWPTASAVAFAGTAVLNVDGAETLAADLNV